MSSKDKLSETSTRSEIEQTDKMLRRAFPLMIFVSGVGFVMVLPVLTVFHRTQSRDASQPLPFTGSGLAKHPQPFKPTTNPAIALN